ncbi:HNH endonuclease [Arenibaculum pallidiluteum]|uniref:HNH endonuclease n=1 Tax=Arenibaculum pallidiluteum TaxID=2812559 RepID=UPI001A979103|nr:HNH endonuclease [Arenibaculum pallidiluteum]
MPADPHRDLPICPLCDRPLVRGASVNEHHLVPRRYKGTETVLLHRICHGKIHAVLSERELRDWYHTIERLRGHPEIEAFRRWIHGKPPEFMARHRGGRRR